MTNTSFEKPQTGKVRILVGRLLCGSLLCLLVAGCTSTQSSRPGRANISTATPPHNLSRDEYPFDDEGNYRTDWIARGASTASSRGRKSSPGASNSYASSNTTTAPKTKTTKTPVAKTAPAPKAASTSKIVSTPKPAPMPVPKLAPAPTPKPAPEPASAPSRRHTIAKGETLWAISRRYGTSVAAIKSANGLSSDTIYPGKTLKIP